LEKAIILSGEWVSMLDIHRLRLLRELKHRGTLSAVAAALSYNPSTISQQLSLLETEVGAQLLEPVGRKVRLTAQAEVLVAHAELILQQMERAEADLAAMHSDVVGTVRIATFQTAAHSLMLPALAVLQDSHPQLQVHISHLTAERALAAVLARDFDLVVAEEFPGQPAPRLDGLDYVPLGRDPLRLALPKSPETADVNEALRSHEHYPWVMEPQGTPARQWSVALCREAGFEPHVQFESIDLQWHVELVAHGHAAALLPDLVWREQAPRVRLLSLGEPQFRTIFTASRAGASRHPGLARVRAALALVTAQAGLRTNDAASNQTS
jgi:DNA-binding transcriptional LysR family regulator